MQERRRIAAQLRLSSESHAHSASTTASRERALSINLRVLQMSRLGIVLPSLESTCSNQTDAPSARCPCRRHAFRRVPAIVGHQLESR